MDSYKRRPVKEVIWFLMSGLHAFIMHVRLRSPEYDGGGLCSMGSRRRMVTELNITWTTLETEHNKMHRNN